ncbi:MAG: DUF1667 domain-containing protein [Candidatus Omnitrophota bacterium]
MRKITCIECPKSCSLSVDIENCRVVKVSGNRCPKGEIYAKTEIESPMRILTATVLAQGLPLKMVPVRTDKAIPKAKILEASTELKKIKITKPFLVGDIVCENFCGLGVNLRVTRSLKIEK